uniref:Nei like DNA glycosylase 1 n=1 Tax=Zonotrichia albicollis TaxID=44394 RepID=A0A8D2NDV1_ZONAL
MGALPAPRAANGGGPCHGGGSGGGLGPCRAAATMPECPELHLAGRFINGACGALVFAGGVERSAVGRGPEVPFRSEAYGISATARGKELRLTLSALDPAAGPPAQDLVFRFGMSGSFRLCPAAELPRHAHLRFLTRESPPRALCFVDPRRFGSWRLGDAWQPERGPCVVSEYQAFRENVLKNLEDRAFDKPICEVLLNQKYFNGIGNYLRAEILYRLKIPPFEKARTVLEALKEQEQERRKKDPSLTLSKKVKLRQESPDLLELCHSVPMEVIMAEKQLLDPEHPDNYSNFKNWLQCYLVPGMSSLRDRSGRTIWFQVGAWEPPNHSSKGTLACFLLAETPIALCAWGSPSPSSSWAWGVTRTSFVVGSQLMDGGQSAADGGKRGCLGALAALFFPPRPCAWGLAGTGNNGRVPKAKGRQSKPNSPVFPGKCGCFPVTAVAGGWRRGSDSADAACRMTAPQPMLCPFLTGRAWPHGSQR